MELKKKGKTVKHFVFSFVSKSQKTVKCFFAFILFCQWRRRVFWVYFFFVSSWIITFALLCEKKNRFTWGKRFNNSKHSEVKNYTKNWLNAFTRPLLSTVILSTIYISLFCTVCWHDNWKRECGDCQNVCQITLAGFT